MTKEKWILDTLGSEIEEEYDHEPTSDDILEYANFHRICTKRVRVSNATEKEKKNGSL